MKHKHLDSKLVPKNVLSFLFQEERRSGLLMIVAAAAALFLANSQWASAYFSFINAEFSLGAITLDLQHWVSEGLLAIFFLVVGLEIKRELIDGELRTWRKASFPVIAAIGGMLLPAIIYSLCNPEQPQASGWAIPIATDIAIAVSVLALLGKRIPKNLRVFLLALAIIDDIGSIIIISLFYSHPTNSLALLGAICFSLALVVLRTKKWWIVSFLAIGVCLWYCLLLAGISGTMAGVIVAALAPLSKRKSRGGDLQSSETLEDILLPLTAYVIVPFFVFVSAGLAFHSLSLSSGDSLSVFVGVAAGLLLGKPLGIIFASWLATKLGLAHKPYGASWMQIFGIGCVAGIGFTISLLIAGLSFDDYPALQNAAVFGVFVASILSGIVGLLILSRFTKLKTS